MIDVALLAVDLPGTPGDHLWRNFFADHLRGSVEVRHSRIQEGPGSSHGTNPEGIGFGSRGPREGRG
jgi:hypothetical protein